MPEPTKKKVVAVCLSASSLGEVGDVVTLDADTAAQAVALGLVDPHPDAVKHARGEAG